MSQYEASVPQDKSLRPGIASFFESFYAISDTAEAHQQYADHFTSDAKLIMGSKETSGRDGELVDHNLQPSLITHRLTLSRHQESSKCATACGRKWQNARTSLP